MMILLQQGPPDTSAYMIAGFIVIFGVLLIYLASLTVRRRNLNRDLEMFEEIEEQE